MLENLKLSLKEGGSENSGRIGSGGKIFHTTRNSMKKIKSAILFIFREDLAIDSPKCKVCKWKYCGCAVVCEFSEFTVPGNSETKLLPSSGGT